MSDLADKIRDVMRQTPPVKIRRDVAGNGKTGWRWECLICPPVRPNSEGIGGRLRGGFHWDDCFVFARMRTRRGAWSACVHAALLHVHVHHHELQERP